MAENLTDDAQIGRVVVDNERREACKLVEPGISVRATVAWRLSGSATVNWKVLPTPGVLSTQIRPFIKPDELRADRQAQPGAAEPPRRRAIGLRERLEDRRLLVGGMPMPVSMTLKCRPTRFVAVPLRGAHGRRFRRAR